MVEEMGATIVSMENVAMTYPTGTEALKGLNLKISKGEFVFVVGASGSGKSTFIKLLLREIAPTGGKIMVNGKDITNLKHKQVAAHRRRIGCVFQDFRLLKERNVYENVAFAQKVIGIPERIIGKNVHHILSLVGLSEKEKAYPRELSGGEQQRVALARALVNRPAILLADEPTGNLDPKNSQEIMGLLEEINNQGTTVIVVTHNHEIVNAMHKRVITMDKGNLISDEEDGTYKNHAPVTYESVESKLKEELIEAQKKTDSEIPHIREEFKQEKEIIKSPISLEADVEKQKVISKENIEYQEKAVEEIKENLMPKEEEYTMYRSLADAMKQGLASRPDDR